MRQHKDELEGFEANLTENQLMEIATFQANHSPIHVAESLDLALLGYLGSYYADDDPAQREDVFTTVRDLQKLVRHLCI